MAAILNISMIEILPGPNVTRKFTVFLIYCRIDNAI